MRDKVGWNRRNEEAGFGRVPGKDERSKRHECWTRTARDGAGDGAAADGAIAPNDEELEDSPAANDPEVIDLTWIHRLESSNARAATSSRITVPGKRRNSLLLWRGTLSINNTHNQREIPDRSRW